MNGSLEGLVVGTEPLLTTLFRMTLGVLVLIAVVTALTVLRERLRQVLDRLGPRAAGPILVVADRVGMVARSTWSAAAGAAAHFVPPHTPPAQVPGAVIVAAATGLLYLALFGIGLAGETPLNALRIATIVGVHSSLSEQPIGDLSAYALSALAVLFGLWTAESLGWTVGIGPWNRAGRAGKVVLATLAVLGLVGTIVLLVILNIFAQVRLALGVDLPLLSIIYAGLFQALLALGIGLSGFCLLTLVGLLGAAVVAWGGLAVGLLAGVVYVLAGITWVLGSLIEWPVRLAIPLADHLYHRVLLQTVLGDLLALQPILPARSRSLDARS